MEQTRTGVDNRSSNRMVLLLIGGIPLTMILAATWLWFFVVRGDLDIVGLLGTSNSGTLLQPPRQLGEHPLYDETGAALRYSELEPRWTMLVAASGGYCDEVCESTLYVTRQIHVAMGKDFPRLRRVFLSDTSVRDTVVAFTQLSDGHPAPAAGEFTRYLETEHKGMQALSVSNEAYRGLFPEQLAAPGTWYLVDPSGWVMMTYDEAVHYKDVISDLKFLVKHSGG